MLLHYSPFEERANLSQFGQGSVLVVEDDSGDEFFILRTLKSLNLDACAVVVHDGEEATDYIFRTGKYAHRSTANDPRVIMLDLCIPRVAGLEVLRLIKEDAMTRHIPVVVMTSSDNKADINRCYDLGANSVVHKGRLIEEFRESVALAVTYWTRVNVYNR